MQNLGHIAQGAEAFNSIPHGPQTDLYPTRCTPLYDLKATQNDKLTKQVIQRMIFGKYQWEAHFGDIGTEPPISPNIVEILNAPCPFWPNKKVKETHLLTLIPATVNGKPLTLQTIKELVKSPKKEATTKYCNFYPGEAANVSITNSHWALRSFNPLLSKGGPSAYALS